MQNAAWRSYFESNLHRPGALVPENLSAIPEPLRSDLVRSLRIFQAGETGEGRIVAEAARQPGSRHDADFVEALRMYVAEEGRHARELGLLVRALGGEPSHTHPSAERFRTVRRLIGFRTKMMVLAGAEVVGGVFYDLVARHAGCAALSRVLGVIVREERAHLVFQRDYFEAIAPGPATRMAYHAALRSVVMLELGYFAVEHRALLRALDTSPQDLVRACNDQLEWLSGARVEDFARSPRQSLRPFAWAEPDFELVRDQPL
ncbi:MAG: hypothetical protein HOV80_08200 [Polyangiaceae bacterium]|nr:hypothetical protein [Polyangiaceae bacterium]